MIDENIQVLKILSDMATSIFINKKSNLSRIEASDFSEDGKKILSDKVIKPLDISLNYISNDITNTLHFIPIYNFFLEDQKGISIYDAAQLISILKDIDNFKTFGNLLSYAGFTPKSKNYNKKLHKNLLRIGYKLSTKNPQYQFVFEIAYQKYREKYPLKSNEHIENMAKRIVIKKFLKNLYFSWNSINGDFE